MDPLTHTLAGASLARTSLGRSTRLAGAALIVGANLPDLDVLSYLAGADVALGFRRGWTHGPVGLLFLPAVWTACLVGLDALLRRRGRERPPVNAARLLALSYLACLTHPMLDWLNTYGVRLLMPFDGRWFYGDAVFIIDPWLWLILGGTAAIAVQPRFSGSLGWLLLGVLMSAVIELGASRTPPAARWLWFAGLALIITVRLRQRTNRRPTRAAAIGLTLALAYVGAMLIVSGASVRWVRGELDRQGVGQVQDLMLGPLPANPLGRDVVVETETGYRHGTFHWLPRPALQLAERRFEKRPASPLVDAALAAPEIQGALGWMRFPYVEIEPTERGHRVHVIDLRYVRRRAGGFGTAVVELDRDLRVIRSE